MVTGFVAPTGPPPAPKSTAMKFAVFSLLAAMSIASSSARFGWLESTVNMSQGLGQLVEQGGTTILFLPLLVLLILLCLVVFVAATLLPVAFTAVLGSLLLRARHITISKVFAERFILIGAIFHFAFVLVATQRNAPLLLGRPRDHAGGYILAIMAAGIAALNLFVAALIVRRISRSHPI